MDWPALIDEMNGNLARLRALTPDASAGFGALAKGATKAGALDAKTKELIALAIGVAVRCDPCIAYHVRACAKLSATREEVAEVAAMCVYMGGGPSLMYGAKALDAFDQLSPG